MRVLARRRVTPGSEPCPGGRYRPAVLPARGGTAAAFAGPHPEGRPCQRPGLPARPPGHQDHPPAAGRRHRQDHPRDRLRRHQPDQRARHRAGPGPPGPRALVHRGTSPYKGHDVQRRHLHQPAAGPPAWPPSAPPSSRPSKAPATCTSPKAAATTPPPPRPSTSTALIRQKWDIHGTRRSPADGRQRSCSLTTGTGCAQAVRAVRSRFVSCRSSAVRRGCCGAGWPPS